MRHIATRTPMQESGSRTVVQIDDDGVLKIGKDLEHDEMGSLKLLEE